MNSQIFYLHHQEIIDVHNRLQNLNNFKQKLNKL